MRRFKVGQAVYMRGLWADDTGAGKIVGSRVISKREAREKMGSTGRIYSVRIGRRVWHGVRPSLLKAI